MEMAEKESRRTVIAEKGEDIDVEDGDFDIEDDDDLVVGDDEE